MKILFITSYRKGKGISPFVKTQADSLLEKGVKIYWFSIIGEGLSGYVKSIFLLKKLLKKKKYDILHAHFGFCGIVAKCAVTKEKVVVSFLGDDLMGSLSANGKYSIIGKVFVFINKFFANFLFDYNIVKSTSLAINIRKKQNLSIIPNGVNLDLFRVMDKIQSRKILALPPNKKIIIFVGNPDRHVKNYILAQKAFELIKTKFDAILIPFKNIPFEQIPRYYNAADVALLTSFHEGSPNVIKEAMASNCPIVATNVGDIERVTNDTHNCFVCRFDEKELAEKMEIVLSDGSRTNGRENVTDLEIGLIADKIIGIYENL
jgi:teichuronic acid biosynthesis glycosyltransferase TuaC